MKIIQHFRDRVKAWNVGLFLHSDATVCPRGFYWILSPQKLQDTYFLWFISRCYPAFLPTPWRRQDDWWM